MMKGNARHQDFIEYRLKGLKIVGENVCVLRIAYQELSFQFINEALL